MCPLPIFDECGWGRFVDCQKANDAVFQLTNVSETGIANADCIF